MNLIIEGSPLPGLPDILDAMQLDAAHFEWYLADVEASTWPQAVGNAWISGNDLVATWVPHETQFIWGVLSAFPLGTRIDVTELPFANGNVSFWAKVTVKPQIEGALFEIVYWDSSAVILVGISEEQGASVANAFPAAVCFP